MRNALSLMVAALVLLPTSATPQTASRSSADVDFGPIDAVFESFRREHHAPGLVYGIVHDGKLIRVGAIGFQDVDSKTTVSADTVFRIASMTKALTALAALRLRDDGKLQLDAPVERYVPEFASIRYPTSDSPRIRIRDLLSHSAGFVYDDPWGDRQLDMSDAAFDAFVRSAFPLARVPQTDYEYSNFGFAAMGRVIRNASGRAYSDYMTREFLRPLGMESSRFEVKDVPVARRALGYRWQDDRWIEEPVLGDGAFGAMGGLHTTANDYAKLVAFLLAAWPPRDGPESQILKRASVREIALGHTMPRLDRRPPAERGDAAGCDTSAVYGLGMQSRIDCRFGMWLTHAGGLPGFGSNVVLLPRRGLAVFAFANVTYAGLWSPVRQAIRLLLASGAFPERPDPVSAALKTSTEEVARIYAAGDVTVAPEILAMNFLLDRDSRRRNGDLAKLKGELGACPTLMSLTASTATQGEAIWQCERGRLRARMLLAPTAKPSVQTLDLDKAN